MIENATRYPLAWPVGWPRTDQRRREHAKFSMSDERVTANGILKRRVPINMRTALDRLITELDRLGASDAILSTNVELRIDGFPKGNMQEPSDTGAAVYFRHKGKPIVMACDKWTTVADNIAAIAQHIDAIRRMDRYGVGRLEQALAGYQRLLSGRRAWFDVLGYDRPPQTWNGVEDAYKSLAKRLHPDAGGSHDAMAELTEAFSQARQEFGR